MGELMNAVKSADDEYLTGLTNKGTVKRAYKDMETAEISAEYGESEIIANVGEEKCTIKEPLAESKCSCPSRSICRHIITAILWLKGNAGEEEMPNPEQKQPDKALTDELSAYPLKLLEKAMKKKYFTEFMQKAQKGILPEIEESGIISVKVDDMTVRLINPLEYSACSCHSKELCRHKAEAVLAWQIKHKIIEPKIEKAVSVEIDVEKARDTAEYALKFLYGILSDGLVRLSEESAEQAETVAVMCHNARLADSERKIREIGSRLEKYIAHSPEFSSRKLYLLIMESVVLLKKIVKAESAEEMQKYSGEFRAEYIVCEDMDLIPVAYRHFTSLDYEGNIYYFVNKDVNAENKFLTYSDIRPKFYETNRRHTYTGGIWGLTGNMNDIMKCEIHLKNPKVSNGKLSSSSETTATLTGRKSMNCPAVYGNMYTDFAKMIREIFAGKTQGERLVFVASEKCIGSEFDEITQTQKILIEDKYNNRLYLKARYTSESREMIDRISRIGNIMLNNPGINYVIFGSVYIENGECSIYPIGVYDDIYVSKVLQKTVYFSEKEQAYKFFARLFEEVQSMLGDVIQCGINSFDLYAQISDNADESRKMGLLELGNMLEKLSEMFRAKNHTYSNDNSEMIELLGKIYAYLEKGISMTEVHIAVSNLKKGD